jgi:radical SAM enzyme (TIGR01210 family)
MMKWSTVLISIHFMPDRYDIEILRPARNKVNSEIPYHFMHEEEPDEHGNLQQVNTIFLTGKECSFKCLMCDLWKNTLTTSTPEGAILKQIDYALSKLPQAEVIKLYNSSNFFDPKAIPLKDYPGIIERLSSYKRVIVENHPKLCNKSCVDFNEKLKGTLEIAMGLETIHPDVLPKLNKQLTAEDFKDAAKFLRINEIPTRAFVLLNPPFLTDAKENIEWAFKTVEFAFECSINCCSIIPTRSGNGIMEVLQENGEYVPPTLVALEEVMERALALQQGRVFVDTWEIGFLSKCDQCFEARKGRLEQMNLLQKFLPIIKCNCN